MIKFFEKDIEWLWYPSSFSQMALQTLTPRNLFDICSWLFVLVRGWIYKRKEKIMRAHSVSPNSTIVIMTTVIYFAIVMGSQFLLNFSNTILFILLFSYPIIEFTFIVSYQEARVKHIIRKAYYRRNSHNFSKGKPIRKKKKKRLISYYAY